MARAKGANAKLRLAEETSGYGVQATTGFFDIPFVSNGVSASQGLVSSDLLGQGREPSAPSQDVIDVNGQMVLAVDTRNIGHVFKFAFGHPVSRPVRASGTLTFSAQPAANSTVTLNGTVWTFVASGASGNQTNIGANLAATLTALATNLNASSDTAIDDATYSASATALTVTSKSWGGGNAYTLAAQAASNATRSGATLAGGGWLHRFRSGGPRARGALAFSANPANNSTLSIGGTTWTFVSGAPSGNQTQIATTLADTLARLAEDLNASADANLVRAFYGCTGTALAVQLQAGGLQAAFAISGTVGANATPTSATALVLAGELPSFTLESALPETNSFFVSTGCKIGSLAFAWQRSGAAQITLQVAAQGETEFNTTQAGTPGVLAVQRLSQFQGSITSGGNPIASLTAASLSYSNDLDPVATIRSDGKIDGYDEGLATATGKITARFNDVTTYRAAAAAGTPIDLAMGWTRSAHESLMLSMASVYLPVPKRDISGPKGIDADYDFQGALSSAGAFMLEAVLRNDVAAY
jgi:hypothetical protein